MKKKAKTLTIFLIVSMVMIVSYTAVHIWMQRAYSVTFPKWLTVCWYTYWGSEIFICAGLRTVKDIRASPYGTLNDSNSEDEAVG